MTLKEIIHSDPDILGGTPVFVGTRVPVRILLDYLEGGEPLEEFLDNYPTVTREQAVAFAHEYPTDRYQPGCFPIPMRNRVSCRS